MKDSFAIFASHICAHADRERATKMALPVSEKLVIRAASHAHVGTYDRYYARACSFIRE